MWSLFLRIVLAADVLTTVRVISTVMSEGGVLPPRPQPIDATQVILLMVLFCIANLVAVARAVQTDYDA